MALFTTQRVIGRHFKTYRVTSMTAAVPESTEGTSRTQIPIGINCFGYKPRITQMSRRRWIIHLVPRQLAKSTRQACSMAKSLERVECRPVRAGTMEQLVYFGFGI